MKKTAIWSLIVLLLFGLALPVLSAADDDYDKEDKEEAKLEKDLPRLEAAAKLDMQNLKSCIISKDFKGIEWVFIRLQPGQYRMLQMKYRMKRNAVVNLKLYPRQRYAVKLAAGLGSPLPATILKVSDPKIYTAKTLKGYYIYRKLDLIKQISAGNKPYVEPAEPADKPSAIFF